MSAAIDWLLEGEWFKLVSQPALDQVGELILSLFLVAIVLAPLWLRSGHVTIPAVMLVLFSGLLIPMLPGQLVGVMWGVVWIAGTVALYAIMNKFR